MLDNFSAPAELSTRLPEQGLELLDITAEHAEVIRAFPELTPSRPLKAVAASIGGTMIFGLIVTRTNTRITASNTGISYGAGGGRSGTDWVGVLLVAAARGCWAIDNNLTQRLSGRDPFALVRFKASVAAGVNLVLAVVLVESADGMDAGPRWPA
ncbi:MAG: hypothetical protein JST73_01015 [Actinobacteria bacterium]|nr:hypothetical protein [Actinomycetota bacterium]